MMCRSKAEGGQRCSAHARAAYRKAVADGVYSRIAETAVVFASTPAGRDHFLEELASSTAQSDCMRVEMILTEGEAIKREAARSAAEQRGIRGAFSPNPSPGEIDGFVWAAAGAAEVQAMTITRGEVASLLTDLNDPATGEPLHVTSLSIRTKEVVGGHEIFLDAIEVGGVAQARGTSGFAGMERQVVEVARRHLGSESLHQLSGDIGRKSGHARADDLSGRAQDGRRALARFESEVEDLVLAQKLGIAQDLPDGVDRLIYSVRRHTSRSSSVEVYAVEGADGRDASHRLSPTDAKTLIRSQIGEFDETVRFQAMSDSQVVSRAHAEWRPVPI